MNPSTKPGWHTVVASTPGSILLQTARFDRENKRSYLFLGPVQTMVATTLDALPKIFQQIEDVLADGLHVAGFISYECGHHFERTGCVPRLSPWPPLAWFGAYRAPIVYDHEQGAVEGGRGLPAPDQPTRNRSVCFARDVSLGITKEEHGAKVRRIQEYIRAGDTYQVNLTDHVTAHTDLDAAAAFGALLQEQPVSYSAFLNIGGRYILSLSPELFFRTGNGKIHTRPMKGTMRRGLDLADDAQTATRLQQDEKNRSEHVMIVDLLRNDLGRICVPGSVQVDDLFSVEKYETLFQMTSTVSGTLRQGISYYEIFRGLFPSGSVTGAPKVRTMQIIDELEDGPRGIYTGSIGYISPGGTSVMNVAIRTLVLQNGVASMGVGGGIVADSDAEEEHRECLLKAAFLTHSRPEFQLLETMLWDNTFPFLSLHLDRMAASALYFGFTFDRDALVSQLQALSQQFQSGRRYRVRALLGADGKATAHPDLLATDSTPVHVCIATERTFSGDVFLRHKTTYRDLYDRQLARARAEGLDEIIFLNEKDEVTEGAISNLFLKKNGKLLTPPLDSGVLPGIFRRHILRTNANAEERVLTLADLQSAETIYLCNSVRGMRSVASLRYDQQTKIFWDQ